MKKMKSEQKFGGLGIKPEVFIDGISFGEAESIYYDYEPVESIHVSEFSDPIAYMYSNEISIVFDNGTLRYDAAAADTIMTSWEDSSLKKKAKIEVKPHKPYQDTKNWYKWMTEYTSKWVTSGYNLELNTSEWGKASWYSIGAHQPIYSPRPRAVDKLPGLREYVKHPVTGVEHMLETVIIQLNDHHGWSREQIADWLETLDVDITFKGETHDI